MTWTAFRRAACAAILATLAVAGPATAQAPGYNAIGMLDTLYFLRGFAVHGYHSVPPYQASHGCARIPLWAARGVYSRWHVGDVVYVF